MRVRNGLVKTILLACLITFSPADVQAAPGDIEVTIMGADVDWAASQFAGHAFMCISLHLNNGVKEECFGFYPKDGGSGFVGTPGATVSEFKKSPTRFSIITVSASKLITETQRRNILKLADTWNAKTFQVVTANCVNFAHEAAKVAGFVTPPLQSGELPKSYVTRLKALNP